MTPREDFFIDSNGCLTERKWVGGQEVIVHYDVDIPESDITVHRGVRCTTALRAVIDVAADIDRAHLEETVEEALERGLFTEEEAWARIREPDMRSRPGAVLLRRVLLERGSRPPR
jgi:hypothetical protein